MLRICLFKDHACWNSFASTEVLRFQITNPTQETCIGYFFSIGIAKYNSTMEIVTLSRILRFQIIHCITIPLSLAANLLEFYDSAGTMFLTWFFQIFPNILLLWKYIISPDNPLRNSIPLTLLLH